MVCKRKVLYWRGYRCPVAKELIPEDQSRRIETVGSYPIAISSYRLGATYYAKAEIHIHGAGAGHPHPGRAAPGAGNFCQCAGKVRRDAGDRPATLGRAGSLHRGATNAAGGHRQPAAGVRVPDAGGVEPGAIGANRPRSAAQSQPRRPPRPSARKATWAHSNPASSPTLFCSTRIRWRTSRIPRPSGG